MNVLVNIAACAIGLGVGYWVRPRDPWAGVWGIAAMFSVAFALTVGGLWFLLPVPLFGLLLLSRRRKA